ncbi:MAG: hypothetical protein Kow0059_13820 [Candidatus Sumerlaeia bacterium]
MTNRKGGFTLIELLIVVAIIAILAAIAVPNFLEAQVRSKVSRQLSNMRTIATALESYAVDTNQYPLTTWTPFTGPGYTNGTPEEQFKFVPGALTTPIAYISSDAAKEDIFRLAHNYVHPLANQIMWHPSLIYAPNGPYTGLNNASTYDAQRRRYGDYVIRSAGPDTYYYNQPGVRADYAAGGWNLASYDPTNGTASTGDIYRSQKRTQEDHI